MPHQGNVYLGYNLVLLVQPLPAEGRRRARLAAKLAERAIRVHAQWHLQVRFCKGDTGSRQPQFGVVNAVLDKYLQVRPLASAEIPSLFREDEGPSVHVLIDISPADSMEEITFEVVRDKIRGQDPSAHVEQFRIECPSKASIDALGRNLASGQPLSPPSPHKEGGIYHLASRICAAFVEYRAPWAAIPAPSGRPRADSAMSGDILGPPLRFRPVDLAEEFHPPGRTDAKAAGVVSKIMDIRDAVDLVCGCLDGAMHYFPPVPKGFLSIFEGRQTTEQVWTRYKFPFGVWFRGSPRVCYNLAPSLFRYAQPSLVHAGCAKRQQEQVVLFDECSMVHHFREYLPEYREKHGSMFDWLCLMQHHGAPTRLLDWTENILYALYFAARERDVDCDGAVWALNAGRLNEITRASSTRRYVCFSHSADVHLRTAMAISHNWVELRRNLLKLGFLKQVLDCLDKDDLQEVRDLMSGKDTQENTPPQDRGAKGLLNLRDKLLYPVAVFPGRGHKRLAAQLGTFTLHGGKVYDPQLEKSYGSSRFARPKSLVALNDLVVRKQVAGKPFLDVWVIPSGSKRKIREQLKRLGVHPAAVFPELDYQSEYMKREWMIPVEEGEVSDW